MSLLAKIQDGWWEHVRDYGRPPRRLFLTPYQVNRLKGELEDRGWLRPFRVGGEFLGMPVVLRAPKRRRPTPHNRVAA